eukprot:gnl/MRDRNA2_/MRDRNA2_485772_c0_seq1.p1 gnl/MRDRNA2_/MRDRNA2_485772_c0~~gnl/MRDRNA2_/MRDRNA2_485772_c0_seq1.p1  ORF type:complete len:165 (-),score=42.86 gnl/MRDRNA2_/MRDRNA2_485772_c0_seq1:73-567(-)
MELVKPDIGLLFWMLVTFTIVLILLRKFAWKPILSALKSREESIENALQEAERAREEMAKLKSDNEDILREARTERDKILKEARAAKESMISDAKAKAKEEADRMISNAREAINNEKMAAVTELSNLVAKLSIEIAEKVTRKALDDDASQKELVDTLIKEAKLN